MVSSIRQDLLCTDHILDAACSQQGSSLKGRTPADLVPYMAQAVMPFLAVSVPNSGLSSVNSFSKVGGAVR